MTKLSLFINTMEILLTTFPAKQRSLVYVIIHIIDRYINIALRIYR
jgi:hypothetical protein